jgi:hypothetical protein
MAVMAVHVDASLPVHPLTVDDVIAVLTDADEVAAARLPLTVTVADLLPPAGSSASAART